MRRYLEKPFTVLAIDPGLSGAAVRIGHNILEARRDFKDLEDVAGAIDSLNGDQRVNYFVIEQVGARPGQGVCSMFSFGKATGVAFGAIYLQQRNLMTIQPRPILLEVHPLKWQNWVRRELGMAKKAPFDSREICLRHFPEHAALFKRKKDHNTADAVLMGLYKLAQL